MTDRHVQPGGLLATTPAPLRPISSRERDVLRLLAEGHSNRAIGDSLAISERTVENHLCHVFAKLRIASRTAAVAWAVRNGIA